MSQNRDMGHPVMWQIRQMWATRLLPGWLSEGSFFDSWLVLNAGIVRLVWLEAILETELDLEWIVGVVTCSGNASEGAWIGEGKTTGL